jgi:hypothetical protein
MHSVNSNLCDAQWRILDQLHGENYACQDYIDREIIRHAQKWPHAVTIVCLRLFILLGGKKLLGGTNCHVEIYGRCEKKQCFRIEGRQILNPKNIISEALWGLYFNNILYKLEFNLWMSWQLFLGIVFIGNTARLKDTCKTWRILQ